MFDTELDGNIAAFDIAHSFSPWSKSIPRMNSCGKISNRRLCPLHSVDGWDKPGHDAQEIGKGSNFALPAKSKMGCPKPSATKEWRIRPCSLLSELDRAGS